MSSTILRSGRSAFFVLAALACSSDDDGGGALDAEMRAVHADPAAGPLDIQVGGTTVIAGLEYGRTSSVVQVPAGTQSITVRSGSQVVAQLDAAISESVINSLLVSAGATQLATQVDPDTGTVQPSRANLRMINIVGANATAPTLLQAKLSAPAPDTVMTFGVDAQVARYGSLMYFDPGQFTMRFVPAGGTDVLTEVTFNVAQGETKAVVLERDAAGTYRATVVVEE